MVLLESDVGEENEECKNFFMDAFRLISFKWQ